MHVHGVILPNLFSELRWPEDAPTIAQYGPNIVPSVLFSFLQCTSLFARSQDGPKIARRSPPRWPDHAPRSPQDRPQGGPRIPRWPQGETFCIHFDGVTSSCRLPGPGCAKVAPRWPQDGPNIAQDRPTIPHDSPKIAPGWPQDRPKVAPRWPQRGAFRMRHSGQMVTAQSLSPNLPQ